MAAETCLSKIIRRLSGDLVYIEIGVLRASNLLALAQTNSRIKKLIGIDSYAPYRDPLHGNYQVPAALSRYNKSIAQKRIKESEHAKRIELLIEDSEIAARRFQDESVDVVFLDKNLTHEETVQDVCTWYEKVRVGGILCGHEGGEDQIIQAVIAGLRDIDKPLFVEVVDEEVWWVQKQEAFKES